MIVSRLAQFVKQVSTATEGIRSTTSALCEELADGPEDDPTIKLRALLKLTSEQAKTYNGMLDDCIELQQNVDEVGFGGIDVRLASLSSLSSAWFDND